MQTRIFASFIMLLALVACQQVSENTVSLVAGIGYQPSANIREMGCSKAVAVATNIIFQSADGGQTWQDVSAGLPADVQVWSTVVTDGELVLSADKGLFRSSASVAPVIWEKEKEDIMPENIMNIFPARSGIYASTHASGFFQNIPGMGMWVPVYKDLKNEVIRTILETPDGAVLVGCDTGIFKSEDGGRTWKKVHEKEMVLNLTASGNAMFACSRRGVLRSADGGENWDCVLSEKGMAFKTELIDGGIAAILNNDMKPRSQDRLLVSTDGCKSWFGIDENLPPSRQISSIKQAGKYLFCSMDEGVFRSTDRGKTWTLVFPSNGKFYSLAVSGQMVYAVLTNAGC